jgi:hypothetical protein
MLGSDERVPVGRVVDIEKQLPCGQALYEMLPLLAEGNIWLSWGRTRSNYLKNFSKKLERQYFVRVRHLFMIIAFLLTELLVVVGFLL